MSRPQGIRLSILTPERPVLLENVDFVVLPLHDGELGVYPLHAALLGKLGHGELRARKGETWTRYYLGGGFVEISGVEEDRARTSTTSREEGEEPAATEVTVLSDEAMEISSLDPAAIAAEIEAIRGRRARHDAELASRLDALAWTRAKQRLARRST